MSSEPSADELSAQLNAFVESGMAAAAQLATERRLPIEFRHVQEALEDVLTVERSESVLRDRLDVQRIIDLLRDYNFASLFPQVLIEITLDEPAIPAGAQRRLEERTVKAAGEVWRVHKSDADPFPSNPHAHNLESGLKLHLGTGELFLKRQLAGKITEEKLMSIRQKLPGVPLPPLAI
jgi:hypothetical protein